VLCLLSLLRSYVAVSVEDEMVEMGDEAVDEAESEEHGGYDEEDEEVDEEEDEHIEPVYPEDDVEDWKDMTGVPDYQKLITHDCNTIREFTLNKTLNTEPSVMEEWISQNRNWKGVNKFVKYNWAYGIPILGMEHFTDDSMRRSCYLVRYLLAGNEQFRKYIYKSKMYIKGDRGGFCCMPNVGNAGQSCPCAAHKKPSFPIKQIFTFAHEMAHWYIGRVLPKMHATGGLTLPEFINTTSWSWQQPYDCEDPTKKREINPVGAFLWNSGMQDKVQGNTKTDPCKTHHYFIYTGQDKYLSLPCGGECKKATRAMLKSKNPNLSNLLENLWPCDNDYVSVCEDSAYGMTKGLAQRLIIGKSDDPSDPSKMTCRDDDTAEIDTTEMNALSPIPKEDVFKPTEKYNQDHCMSVINRGGWLTDAKKNYELPFGKVAESLHLSHERAWWLRKCCARTAKFVDENDADRNEREAWEVEEKRKKDLATAEAALVEALAAENQAIADKNYANRQIPKAENKVDQAERYVENSANQAKKKELAVDEKDQNLADKIEEAGEADENVKAKRAAKSKADETLEEKIENKIEIENNWQAMTNKTEKGITFKEKVKPARKEFTKAENAVTKAEENLVKAVKAADDGRAASEMAVEVARDQKTEAEEEYNHSKNFAERRVVEANEAREALSNAEAEALQLTEIAEEKIKSREAAENLVDQLVVAQSAWAREQIRLAEEKIAKKLAEKQAAKEAEAEDAEAAEGEAAAEDVDTDADADADAAEGGPAEGEAAAEDADTVADADADAAEGGPAEGEAAAEEEIVDDDDDDPVTE